MKRLPTYQWIAAAIAAWMLIIPPCLAAPNVEMENTGATPPVPVVDLALGDQGSVTGTVVDPQGVPQPNCLVRVLHHGVEVARGRTDEQGRFRVTGARGGVLLFAAISSDHAGGAQTVRAWVDGTAPPASTEDLQLVVASREVVRGQTPLGAGFLSDPILIGVVIAGAIAIPIIVHGQQDNDTGS